MKTISPALQEHISQEVTTLATCWKLTRKDGVVSGYTDHDSDLTISGLCYKAETGFTPTAVQTTAGFSVDNLDIEGMLSSESISEEDIIAGLYDFAEIEVFTVNYCDLTQGKIILRTGWLGEVSFSKNHFVAEVRGLMQALSQKIGDVFSPGCRALLGDEKCGVNIAAYRFTGIVSTVSNRHVFSSVSLINSTEYFNYGKVKFTSGANNRLEMEVKDYIKNGNITLALPMPYNIATGDGFIIEAGCDKNFKTCCNKFGNAVNFRGEPHVPGMDKIMETSATRSK